MNDDQLQFDRTCYVIYSKPCKVEIREKIARHYPNRSAKPSGSACRCSMSTF